MTVSKPSGAVNAPGKVVTFPGKGRNAGAGSAVEDLALAEASAELRYAMDLVRAGEYAIGGELPSGEVDTSMYRWEEGYWKLHPDKRMAVDALRWLRSNQADKTNASLARACVETAALEMLGRPECLLPKCGSRAIIPLRGAYLEILKNGTVVVHEPDPSFGLTYQVPVSFDPSQAEEDGCYIPREVDPQSKWGQYLARFMPDLEVRDLLQEATASSFLPMCLEKGFFLVGSGSNGKSTFLHILRALHPKHAAIRVDKLDGQFALNSIVGKTAIFATEMPKVLSTAIQDVLKALFSRDPMQVEPKGRDTYTTTPISTFFGSVNEWFTVSGHEHGFWRKVLAIPFSVRMGEGEERITDFHKLITEDEEEMRQVLNWILGGAIRLIQRGGFSQQMPQAVKDLAAQNRIVSDTVVAWLTDREVVNTDPGIIMSAKADLYANYREFVLVEAGKKPVSAAEFWKRVREQLPYANFQQLNNAGEKVRVVNLWAEGVKPVRDNRQDGSVSPRDAVAGRDDVPF